MGMLCKVKEFWNNGNLFDELKGEWDIHSADDLAVCLGDLNVNQGRHIDGFYFVHGGYGVGQMNLEGRMLLEFGLEKELCSSNKCFKTEEGRSEIIRLGDNDSEIDFVFTKKEH